MQYDADFSDFDDLGKEMKKWPAKWEKREKQALHEVGALVVRGAKKRSPISPTKSQYVSTLKGGKTKRSAGSFTPNTLTNSIMHKVGRGYVRIFVALNKGAGEYAERMHNGNYGLGVGSKAKRKKLGARVGKEFIPRGFNAEKKNVIKVIELAIDRFRKDISK